MKRITERINAKLTLLRHLQGEGLVKAEIVPAAKAKLGADLVDAMKGEAVQELLNELIKKRDRLTARRFEEGDEVSLQWRGRTVTATVVSCEGDTTRLRSSEVTELSLFNTTDLTSADLSDLSEILAACSTLSKL